MTRAFRTVCSAPTALLLLQLLSHPAAADPAPAYPLLTGEKTLVTFMGVPRIESLTDLRARVAFLGIPFDHGATQNGGQREGPQALRVASLYQGYTQTNSLYDMELHETILKGLTMADVGDVVIHASDYGPNIDKMTSAVKQIREHHAIPVVFGGDHSITFPVLRGFEGVQKKIHIIHFDSHLDFSESPMPNHSTPIRRSIDLPWVSGATSIGTRGTMPDDSWERNTRKRGLLHITALETIRMGMRAAIAKVPAADSYYVTFDVDVMDPAIVPATGTPEPGGFNYYQMKELLTEVAKKGHIVGFDVVELSPPLDSRSGSSAAIVSRLIIDFLGALNKYHSL